MSQHVDIRPMASHEFAATVEEGQTVTHHRVVLPPDLAEEVRLRADQLAIPDYRIVSESLDFLLADHPNTALPHDIDLARLSSQNERYLAELHDRLVAMA
ncbi:hypothetical protein N8J89_15040 [Crossiella sp. CA-258035]|uniref:hypothetical protein n=1 Tax=Crossiella sp. CA-258035 TaxID=2981138 RepID=UPI0024BC2F34|nr:hypothetical protein [Crossiella sp. CA-258035]WHT22327.1 hypothetical protein N8J89_15040 [Crossiella sp. CA-258035]